MNKNEIRFDYEKRKNNFLASLAKAEENITLISNLRLATAIFILVLFYFAFTNVIYGYLSAAALILFLFLVKKHAVLFKQKTHLENLVKINITEKKYLDRDFFHLPDGKRFIDPHHPYSHDLDIFGQGSLYQYINRCNTHSGQKKLANLLSHPVNDKKSILENQEAIKELAPKIEFRQHFQASGTEAGEQSGDTKQLLVWLKQKPFLPVKPWLRTVLFLIPGLTVASIIGSLFFPLIKVLLFSLIITQWIIAGVYLKKVNVFHDYISRKKNILQKYSLLLFHLEQEKFSSSKLKHLATSAHEAHDNVNKLASLVGLLDARTNALMTFLVNSVLMYDLQCVYRLEKWKEQNATSLPQWIDSITEAEVLNSFATFYYNNPSFCFSEINDRMEIAASKMAHPLLKEEERVPNELTLGPDPSVAIITGANMAGKSTFLRTLGINVVLALNGAPVCAETFSCPLIEIRSGMRTADSLKDHQSYFFAELNRLKGIMDDLRSNKPLLILLDEILKGTNSNDKQAGSIALVKQLLPYQSITIIATHDLALGDLQNEYPRQVVNYCFEANIENDQLSFDYKLKKGLAQRMNASFLMKKMGIIP